MIQELLGYGDGRTTLTHSHVLNCGLVEARSPVDIAWKCKQVDIGPVNQC